jgi:hypothetical protein
MLGREPKLIAMPDSRSHAPEQHSDAEKTPCKRSAADVIRE